VATSAGGEARSAGDRFSEDRESSAHLVGEGAVFVEALLLEDARTIGTQAGLRQARQLGCQLLGRR
jgi:hypothetical protein